VGHPGETPEDFTALKNFVTETGFDNLGVFAYSPEEGTPSYTLADAVPDEVKQERLHEIMTLQRRISRRKNEGLVGRQLRVLFEGAHEETPLLMHGRHAGQAPGIDGQVLIRAGTGTIGEFCDVTIVAAHDYDLVGEIRFDA
jgi:ribosomal protein S12 methylthiotransferase